MDSHSLTSKAREYVSSVFVWGSPVAFRFDLVSAAEDDLGIEVKTIPVVPAAALPAIQVPPLEESKHVAVREIVLDAFQRGKRVHGV